jgi:prepilin peptidase CpaA
MGFLDGVRLVAAIGFTGVVIWAAISDVRFRKIPNWTILALLALFPFFALASTLSWALWSLAGAVVVFVITYALYALKALGAGDSKLFSVVALFVGLGEIARLGVLAALVGGLIALVFILSRPRRALAMWSLRGKGDFGSGIPYGVAIAVAGMAIVWAEILHIPTRLVLNL